MPKQKHLKFCACGCGEPLRLIYTNKRFKGYSGTYAPNCKNRETIIHKPCPQRANHGHQHPKFLPVFSERIEKKRGIPYIIIKISTNPDIWIYKHRWLMEKKLGRKLLNTEIIHHRNKNSLDNSYKNLALLSSIAEHNEIHSLYPSKWAKQFDKCIKCYTTIKRHVGLGLCTTCYQQKKSKK
jgi:hypothetical protein